MPTAPARGIDVGEGGHALSPLARTLLLPLWGRAAFGRLEPASRDPLAESLLRDLSLDDAALAQGMGTYGVLAFGLRARFFDECARAFLSRHPEGTLVNLGAGLDTWFHRTDNGRSSSLCIDLPDAIALRAAFLPPPPRERLVAGSVTSETTLTHIPSGRPACVALAGLSMYLHKAELMALFAALDARLAPDSVVLMDGYSPVAAWLTNRMIRYTGLTEAPVHAGASDLHALHAHAPRLVLRAQRCLLQAPLPPLPRGAGLRAQLWLARRLRFTRLFRFESVA